MSGPHDVAIVGGGLAGISAALRAQELGADVVVFERGQTVGGAGSSRISGGVFHLAGVPIDLEPDEAYEHITEFTDGQAPPALVRAVADRCKSSIEWLEVQGVPFASNVRSRDKWVIAPRIPAANGRDLNPENAPDLAMRNLHRRLMDRGGTIYYGARAQALNRDEGNRAWTVTARSPEPGGLAVAARAVVIADGGFQANAALVDRYVGPHASRAALRAMETATGDGLLMATAVGAAMAGEGHGVYGHVLHRTAIDDARFLPYPYFDNLCSVAPLVDDRGRLFDHGVRAGADYDRGYRDGVEIVAKMLASPDPSAYFLLLDGPLWSGPATEHGQFTTSLNPTIPDLGGLIHRAATLEDLARRSGMEPGVLAASVERHNASGGTKLETAPFYAVPVTASITFTFPGLAINERAEVLDTSGHAIPGLYAAGSSGGGLQGKLGGGGYVGGLSIALVTGIIAGEAAASRT